MENPVVTDRFGNELNVGDEVTVFYDIAVPFDPLFRTGTLVYIADDKRTAKVLYPRFTHSLAIDKTCLVLASDPNVSMLVLQL